jgi:hypothetical protein
MVNVIQRDRDHPLLSSVALTRMRLVSTQNSGSGKTEGSAVIEDCAYQQRLGISRVVRTITVRLAAVRLPARAYDAVCLDSSSRACGDQKGETEVWGRSLYAHLHTSPICARTKVD